METVDMNNEILMARAENYADRVAEKLAKICVERKENIEAMVNICNGEWLNEAIELVSEDILNGKLDNMLMPKQFSL